MTRPAHMATLAITMILTSACVSRESLSTTFRGDLDACVGKTFMDPTSWVCNWSDAIGKREVNRTEDEYVIAPEYMGKCRWVYVVDRNSRRVTSWHYVSGKEDCYLRIDWLGAW